MIVKGPVFHRQDNREQKYIDKPPNIDTAPAGILLPLAVLRALGLTNEDSPSSG